MPLTAASITTLGARKFHPVGVMCAFVAMSGGLPTAVKASDTVSPLLSPQISEEKSERREAESEEVIGSLPDAPAAEPEEQSRVQIAAQGAIIAQHLFPFRSRYQGPQSVRGREQNTLWHTTTLYLGGRINSRLEAYLNPEFTGGGALEGGHGLGSYFNVHVIEPGPHIARAFVRWTTPLGSGKQDTSARPTTKVDVGENTLPGEVPVRRLVVSAGKFGSNDFFDLNAYANDPHADFISTALANNPAWDYAQDFRGVTGGVAVEWFNPGWVLRCGSFQMPRSAGSGRLDWNLERSRADYGELEVQSSLFSSQPAPTVARFLAYRNQAGMGSYGAALSLAHRTGETPDVTRVRREGNVKYGFGINVEQPLADEGATGLFARWGWNDGRTESFAYDEVDRTLSLGVQISGRRWGRPHDRIGLALAQNEISSSHRRYLAAGGLAINLGDGQLRYRPERLFEAYYDREFAPGWAAALIYQHVTNPGYNADRGPASVLSLRVNRRF